VATWCLGLSLGLAAVAQAESDSPAPSQLQLNGFGTIGAVTVDSSPATGGFRREVTQPARADRPLRLDTDSRLGLQADWQPSTQLEFLGQVVLKPRPPRETNQESITQAFAAWHLSPEWTLRAGRTSPDLFLLADARNVGFAYPWMRPSVEFYGWMPARTLDGLDVTRQWTTGDMRWRAKVYGGQSMVSFADNTDFPNRARIKLFGGTLTLDTGDLTIKATVARVASRPTDFQAIEQARQALGQLAALPVPVVSAQAAALADAYPGSEFVTRYAALGAVWDHHPWQAQAEISHIDGNFGSSRAWYGYASLARRFGQSTTLFAMAGLARDTASPLARPQWTPALTPVIGPALAAQAQGLGSSIAASVDDAREDQHSISFGARYELGAQAALKAQIDDVHIGAEGGGLWGMSSPSPHHARVYSLGLDFIF
jgi:hypothetical protein